MDIHELIEKFNDKYADLNSNQKATLKEFINSVDNTPKLKEFYNTKINFVSSSLSYTSGSVTSSLELQKHVQSKNKVKAGFDGFEISTMDVPFEVPTMAYSLPSSSS